MGVRICFGTLKEDAVCIYNYFLFGIGFGFICQSDLDFLYVVKLKSAYCIGIVISVELLAVSGMNAGGITCAIYANALTLETMFALPALKLGRVHVAV